MVLKEMQEQKETKRFLESHQRLDEVSLHRIFEKYYELGFIIISSDRSCEAEKGADCTDEEIAAQRQSNIENRKLLQKQVRKAGFSYLPVFGGYKEKVAQPDGSFKEADTKKPESSLIVPAMKVGGKKHDPDSLYKLALKLIQPKSAGGFNQDSFLWKPPQAEDSKAYFIDQAGNTELEFEAKTANDLTQPYYTYLKTKWKDTKRFSMTECFEVFINNHPKNASEAFTRYGEDFFKFSK